jgi:hypothetical protein
MRKLIPIFLLLLTAPAFAQDKIAMATNSPEFLNAKFWSDLGKPTEGSRGYAIFTRNMQPKSDTLFELWIKIVPTNATAFNRRYSLPRESAFVIQKATVDCARRLVFTEQTTAFDGSNKSVDPKGSDLVKGETRTRVKSGSVGETVFEYLCLKLQ